MPPAISWQGHKKSIQEQKGPGCSKTFIHDGDVSIDGNE
jgi:hypothetical protein